MTPQELRLVEVLRPEVAMQIIAYPPAPEELRMFAIQRLTLSR